MFILVVGKSSGCKSFIIDYSSPLAYRSISSYATNRGCSDRISS
ncbi:hypothetical protein [Nostoc sp. FACHB-280]|nr:hypothetical protein [Nostoc sp. FACHB-280]